MNKTPKNNEDCMELKNINYKNVLFNGTTLYEHKNTNDINNLDSFLENEKQNNKIEQWSKLDKCEKIKKLNIFVKTYKETHHLSDEMEQKLLQYFKDLLDKKMLQRVKDVIYDKETGIIKDIPNLLFNKQTKNFTIKNTSNKQHISTLKSLAPKKNNSFSNKNIKSPITIIHDESSAIEYNG